METIIETTTEAILIGGSSGQPELEVESNLNQEPKFSNPKYNLFGEVQLVWRKKYDRKKRRSVYK